MPRLYSINHDASRLDGMCKYIALQIWQEKALSGIVSFCIIRLLDPENLRLQNRSTKALLTLSVWQK